MTQTAKNYAQAIYGLCVQDHTEAETLAQLRAAYDFMRGEQGYLDLLSSPAIPKSKRIDLLDCALAGQYSDRVTGFLKVLISHGQMGCLGECIEAMGALYDDAQGILTAVAVSAVPLTDEQADALTRKLSERTGRTVRLNRRVDPGLIGGVTVYVDGKVFDGSIRRRLNELKDVMKQ